MAAKKTVFVTGGTGYIGSHCILELLNEGYDVITADNLINSYSGVLRRVEELAGKKVIFYLCDLLDGILLNKIFSRAMKNHDVYKFVFSSSCTVYGDPEYLPIDEDHKTGNVTNVYGRTKYLIEEMLKDLARADQKWNIISLRYFNPVGAHPSGKIGEDPTKTFTNLMPYIGEVAIGKKPALTIFGHDYDTPDGTGIRDYIHVVDLAAGHVTALHRLSEKHQNFKPYNLGLGHGLSVKEIVQQFEKTSGVKIPYTFSERRIGDVAKLVCDAKRANEELHWQPTRNVNDMCEDFWRWKTMNPNGYADDEQFPAIDLSDSAIMNGETKVSSK